MFFGDAGEEGVSSSFFMGERGTEEERPFGWVSDVLGVGAGKISVGA